MSATTVVQPAFEFFADAEPKTEPGKDAESRLYGDTPRPEDAARRRFAGSAGPDSHLPGHGDLTLGERISSVWEGSLRTGTADCPVCRGTMVRTGHSARCRDCGSVLS
jgi:hypothetical protein